MKRTATVLALLALCMAFGGAAFAKGQAEPPGRDPIRLGGLWPLSDAAGDQGSKAARLAVKEINAAGGVLGRKLELLVADEGRDPRTGAAAVESLAAAGVEAFLGGVSSAVHLAQIPVLGRFRKPTVWTGAAASACEAAVGADADWYFHVHPWDYQQGAGYVDGWKAVAARYPAVKVGKWFLAYEERSLEPGAFSSFRSLYAALGSVDGEPFPGTGAGGGDFSSVLRRAQEAGPDAFLWVGGDADTLRFLERAKAAGFSPSVFVGAPAGAPDFGRSPLAEGVAQYGMWTSALDASSAASRRFHEAYRKEYGEEPVTYFAPLGYSAVHILSEAIRRSGSLAFSALVAALEQTRYESPLGDTLSFAPSALIKHQGTGRQKILQWQGGVLQVIWPFDLRTADWKSR